MTNNVTIIFSVSSAVVVLIIIVVYQLGWVDHLRHLLIYCYQIRSSCKYRTIC